MKKAIEMKRPTPGSMIAAVICGALAAVLPATPVAAQGVMFQANQLTEEALIDALTPPPPGVRTRSIMVQPRAPGTPGENPRAGAASISITFPTNSSEITPSSRSALDVIARALVSDRLTRFSFAVEGHADPRGGSEYNLRLSQARAESVVNYLVHQHGVPIDRLSPIGKGDTELANHDVPTAPENRRVTFKTETR
ncbi:MAG: OmpA family protein [Lautropia sp.]